MVSTGISRPFRRLDERSRAWLGAPANWRNLREPPSRQFAITTSERLQRVRAELAVILRHRAPIDLPAAFSTVAEGLSSQDRSMLMIYSRVFDKTWLDELRNLMLNEPRTSVDEELDALPADADRPTRQRLAEQLAPGIRRQYETYPALTDLHSHTSRGAETAKSAVTLALQELYNPAQLEVLYRADMIARGVTDERLDALDARGD